MESDLTIDRILPPLMCSFIHSDHDASPAWLNETRYRLQQMQSIDQPPTATPIESPAEPPSIAQVQWQLIHQPLDRPLQMTAGLQPKSFAAVHIALSANPQQRQAYLRLVHQLHRENIVTTVIFESLKRDPESRGGLILAFRAAGAVAVVTSLCECDRLASVILKTAMTDRHIFAGWQDRFVNRLPWQPVNQT